MTSKGAILHDLEQRADLDLLVVRLRNLLDSEAVDRERFREQYADSGRHEFVRGKVIEDVAARQEHSFTMRRLVLKMCAHAEEFDLGECNFEGSLVAAGRSDYFPDIAFWAGQTFAKDTVVYPAPTLVVEVLSPSTERKDRHEKFEDYARAGVQEYWLVDCDRRQVEQYLLGDGAQFEPWQTVKEGALTSKVMTGFETDLTSLFMAES